MTLPQGVVPPGSGGWRQGLVGIRRQTAIGTVVGLFAAFLTVAVLNLDVLISLLQ